MADRRLQVFHTVAKVMSFTKAAETLHMTQPAVTFQVKQLEDFFNTRLFDRTHNKITLTDAGKVVYDYADQILELYEKMNSQVRELTGEVTGTLVVGASTTIAEYMLPSLLGAFKKEFEEVNIRLQVGNTDAIVSMVENNMIDLGLVEAPVHNKNLEVDVFINGIKFEYKCDLSQMKEFEINKNSTRQEIVVFGEKYNLLDQFIKKRII